MSRRPVSRGNQQVRWHAGLWACAAWQDEVNQWGVFIISAIELLFMDPQLTRFWSTALDWSVSALCLHSKGFAGDG